MMEVHPHPHSHGKKSWKQYFWEFFMLFLAVTLGFFVENQREHYIEHQREKLYMKAMVDDLKKDTVMLRNIMLRTKTVIENVDSALTILVKDKRNNEDIKILYRVNLKLLSNISPAFTDRTTVQLKNAGAMRLIRNETSVNGIVDYWSQADMIKAISENFEDYRMQAREASYSIFDQRFFNNPIAAPQLMIRDEVRLTEFANRLSHIKNIANNRYLEAIRLQIENAKKLIDTINLNY
jgi:hypothetical protein